MLTECVTGPGAYAKKVDSAILTNKTENSTIIFCVNYKFTNFLIFFISHIKIYTICCLDKIYILSISL